MPDPIPEWPPTETEIITAELVACTLGQRHRPELSMDFIDRLNRMARDLDRFKAAIARGMLPALQAAGAVLAALLPDLNRRHPEDPRP